ncbi:MAG: 4-(cytidine 5'-diphospho)-2-C-methyl-D-erythritol kinase [Clostridia bacterium]|jgi:4-diphosphocytidyl-2-C-methyl-D-erythritol kinase|nr:4-(cytidine 5'-diphospho)-2-C-methyl-D-erythritol kinase [Clostridia bacterium]
MKLKANAKINLLLDITGVKENGYHSLFTIMQSVSLGDEVTVERTQGEEITVSCNVSGVPTDKSNIVYKCAEKFFQYSHIEKDKGIHIHIDKKTPFGAGMGGGSADGAAVLVALNKLFGTAYHEKILCRIGAMVGADIPFCIVGGTALCLDTGAIVAPLEDMEGYTILIVKPQSSVSTKEAYAAVDALTDMKHPKNQQMLQLLSDGRWSSALKLCSNVFEQAIEIPGRVDIKDICNKNGAAAACMTGSGSAVFGIFENAEDAQKAADILKDKFKEIYICAPSKQGVEILSE